MRKAWITAFLVLSPVMAEVELVAPAVRTTIILVKGAAGESEFAAKFEAQLDAWKKAASDADAETIVVAGAEAGATARARLEKALTSAPSDGPGELWIVLMGHGTWDGKEARFNLEGPDLSAAELAAWLRPIQRPLVVINTASCSGPFLSTLAAPGRVVITATRSGSERNYARFGEHLAAVLGDPSADYDQDGRLSLLEWFLNAASRTTEFYKKQGRIVTEHALLDDNGDGKGTPADWFRGLRATKKSKDNTPLDGPRAHQRHLIPDAATRHMSADQLAARDKIEIEIAALRERRDTLPEADYYGLLETLLLRLAELYE